jgi:glycosyltransferase involved in cell wall biosynthesis
MKIAHYLSRFRLEDGGVTRAVLDLCTALSGRAHRITMLTFDPSDVPPAWRNSGDGVPRIEPLTRVLDRLPRLSRASVRQARRVIESVDLVHLHVPWDPVCAQLARLALAAGTPYIVSLHGMLDDWCMEQCPIKKRVYLSLMGQRTLHRAAAVHCTAKAELEQSSKWFPDGNGVIVPLVFDTAAFKQLPGSGPARRRFGELSDGRPVVLFLSRIHYKKGIEHLVRAAARLRDEGRDVLVLVVGSGDEPYVNSLKSLVRDLDLDRSVRFPGFVSGVEKVSLYQAADVFVLPTSQENFGFVLFEALAAETPVVTTRGADTWPEIEGSGGAVIVDANERAIAGAVTALLDEPARRRRMGASGRKWVMENLSIEVVVQDYIDLYTALIA